MWTEEYENVIVTVINHNTKLAYKKQLVLNGDNIISWVNTMRDSVNYKQPDSLVNKEQSIKLMKETYNDIAKHFRHVL